MPGDGMRSISADFVLFQSVYPLLKVHLPRTDKDWAYYQGGPAGDENPIVFLHNTSTTAGCFFYQVDALASKGYRVLSAQYPAYSAPEDWCKGFDHFLDATKCRQAHIFGAGLGGFLAQHFAARYPHRVRSLVLLNSFTSTTPFAQQAGALASFVGIVPSPFLRKVVLEAFPQTGMELSVKQAIDWVAQQVNNLSGADLASRLSLNCTACSVSNVPLDQSQITIMQSNGETMVPEELTRELRHQYPLARVAQLKSGGDFPYLSRPEDVTLFIEVHMRGLGAWAQTASGMSDVSDISEENANLMVSAVPDNTDLALNAPKPRRSAWRNPFEDDHLL